MRHRTPAKQDSPQGGAEDPSCSTKLSHPGETRQCLKCGSHKVLAGLSGDNEDDSCCYKCLYLLHCKDSRESSPSIATPDDAAATTKTVERNSASQSRDGTPTTLKRKASVIGTESAPAAKHSRSIAESAKGSESGAVRPVPDEEILRSRHLFHCTHIAGLPESVVEAYLALELKQHKIWPGSPQDQDGDIAHRITQRNVKVEIGSFGLRALQSCFDNVHEGMKHFSTTLLPALHARQRPGATVAARLIPEGLFSDSTFKQLALMEREYLQDPLAFVLDLEKNFFLLKRNGILHHFLHLATDD
ncbi:hypothetical protein Slin15195_G040600 [Septoria linicola]|uniref:Uncharacterized protein n=1 Tax=Septoria linicola TaxID=215465 RepID=A0A9Q9AU33_9PEZI|nr:hypothetical protein Slin14017_G044130 [Septoria linicola]USW50741.1 hypothetical protein Slin15195_G040600 [Septoria linicola]